MNTLGPFQRVQKFCTLWTHDASYSSEDVVFNLDRFRELDLQNGSLAQIIVLPQGTAVRDFQESNNANGTDKLRSDSALKSKSAHSHHHHHQSSLRAQNDSTILTFDESGARIPESRRIEGQRSYVFVVKDASPELKLRSAGLQVSVSNAVASAFGFRKRMAVIIATADEAEHSASHVEVSFKDEYLSRADMWRLATSELAQRTVYRDQKLLFMGTIKATVKNVWINGQRRKSGYFNGLTKPIFRSESARYILFIQMSREMWDFDSEGAGEIMFNKVTNGFLPELFKNWMAINAHHLVTIVMFTRLEYETDSGGRRYARAGTLNADGLPGGARDFYRVVVSEMSSNDWIKILYQLKKEFLTFLRDVTVQRLHVSTADTDSDGGSITAEGPEYVIVGKPTQASDGNVLEAINLASSQFSKDYIDRDLARTGISVVVITAGTGVYEVDYSTLKLTTDTLVGSGIGIDLVCLSPLPLHSVPLFKYRIPKLIDGPLPMTKTFSMEESIPRQFTVGSVPSAKSLSTTPTRYSRSVTEPAAGEWSYAMPHWIDVSFWTGTADEQAMMLKLRKSSGKLPTDQKVRDRQFDLRCRMYELQMMGVMENEMTNIVIQHLHENPLHPWQQVRAQMSSRTALEKDRRRLSRLEHEWMDEYDTNVFRTLSERRDAEAKAREEALGQKPITPSHDQFRLPKTSYKDPGLGAMASNYRPNIGYLDWKLKEKTPEPTSSILRKPSLASIHSTAESTTTKGNRYSRQISFGLSTTGTSKAIASMDVSTAFADARPTALSRNPEDESIETSSKYTRQFRAALNRNAPSISASGSRPSTPSTEDLDIGSKPIKITSSRPLALHSRTSSSEVDSRSATLRGNGVVDTKPTRNSPTKPIEPGPILHAASTTRIVGPRPDLSSSADGTGVQTLSPTSALAPWLVLVNPCNPRKNKLDVSSQFRRWQHVFPRQLRTASMKWKSLCSPASVPLTNDYFPTAYQLENEYEESLYRLSPNIDDDMAEAPKTRDGLIRELIGFRLAHGFQLIIGPSVSGFLGAHGSDLVNIFDHDYMAKDGATVFMSVASTIHQLICTTSGEIEVRRFNRKPTAAFESTAGGTSTSYRAYIRTALESNYEPREIIFKPPRTEYNWNYIDTFIAGYHEEFSETLRFWRARFVLIPVEVPARGRRPLPELAEDSPEEIRLEGIRKLTQVWQRHRVQPHDERNYQSMQRRKDPNPLDIEYQTRDPSAILAAGPESGMLSETDSILPSTGLFSETELYSTKSVDVHKLAQDLQGDNGLRILDRRWHWRLHYHSFSGADLVTWLLSHFRDLETREDAEAYGNELMEKGLFQHSQKRHRFRDGHFFYRISEEFRAPQSRSSWFGFQRGDRSIPQTPMIEAPRSSAPTMVERSHSRLDTSSSSDINEKEGEKTPRKDSAARRRVTLSDVMRYDVDPRNRSYRPEIINLHYDRLHNPDNCYHIRIDWMNVTPKFIEDAIGHWAMAVERFGLKLVEVPIAEASTICDTHPFRSPYMIQLAVPPPAAPPVVYYDTNSFAAQTLTDKWAYHKALLRKFNFVLDVEAASSFPADVDVTYSWGKPEYRYTQYIHKTGVVLAEITDDGHILMLANRLCKTRSSASKLDVSEGVSERQRPASARSPTASPLARPVSDGHIPSLPKEKEKSQTAEEIKDDIEAFCKDADALRKFYDTAIKPPATPSPRMTPTLSVMDAVVPSLRLPPPTTGIGRDTSPQANKAG